MQTNTAQANYSDDSRLFSKFKLYVIILEYRQWGGGKFLNLPNQFINRYISQIIHRLPISG